jgi:hypothetical protein
VVPQLGNASYVSILCNQCNLFVGSDIYAVEVLSDDALRALENPSVELAEILSSYTKDTHWSAQFSYVEKLRCILRFHSDVIDSTVTALALECVVDSLDSLRSSTLRNGIFCGAAFVKSGLLGLDDMFRIVRAIAVKVAGGPKFINERAEASLNECLQGVETWNALYALLPVTDHKNSDVVSRTFVVMGGLISRLDASFVEVDAAHYPIIRALAIGLTRKGVAGKASCRSALKHIYGLVSVEIFGLAVKECKLLNSQFKVVEKEVGPCSLSLLLPADSESSST